MSGACDESTAGAESLGRAMCSLDSIAGPRCFYVLVGRPQLTQRRCGSDGGGGGGLLVLWLVLWVVF